MPRAAFALPALTIAAALVASTAVAGAADASPAAPAAEHGRSAVTFTSPSHHVKGPAATRPGIAHLRYTGKDEIVIVEAKHPARASAHQVADALDRNSPKSLLKNYRLTAALVPKSGVYTRLSDGVYYLADVFADKIKASDIRTMTVRGTKVDADVPTSRAARITSHRDLSLPSTLPKSGWLHLTNHSSSLGDFLLFAVSPKATNAQLEDLVAHPTEKKLEKVEDVSAGEFGFAALLVSGPHSSSWFHYRGSARRYVAELQAYTGGHSHLHHGEVRVLTLK